VQFINLGADPTDWLGATVGKPKTAARVREVWVPERKLLPSLYQQMRNPCWVVGIDRPRHANEPAQVPRVTYRDDSYGFGGGTHCRSLLVETEAGKRQDATGITTHSSFR
jgi:hypothetical protein